MELENAGSSYPLETHGALLAEFEAVIRHKDGPGLLKLLESGADVEFPGCRRHHTPLYVAARTGSGFAVRALLSHGADQYAGGRFEESPLYLASENDNLECCRYFVQAWVADRRPMPMLERSSAIRCAAIGGDKDLVRVLLPGDRGLNSSAFESCYTEALTAAASHGHEELLGDLIPQMTAIKESAQTGAYADALSAAASKGHVKCCHILVEPIRRETERVHLERLGRAAAQAVGTARASARPVALQTLLDAGVPIDAPSALRSNVYSALHRASHLGHLGALRLLAGRGADPDVSNAPIRHPYQAMFWEPRSNFEAPAAMAAANSSQDALRLLLKHGADPLDPAGPLAAASDSLRVDHVEILLDAGVMPVLGQKGPGKHPLWAMKSPRLGRGIAELQQNQAELTLTLLARGADPGVQQTGPAPCHNSALIVALSRGNPRASAALLRHGADVFAVDRQGQTMMHMAAQGGCARCVDLVSEFAGPAGTRDMLAALNLQGMTPLMACSLTSGCELAAEAMLRLGADRNQKAADARGWKLAPIEACVRHGRMAVAAVLMRLHHWSHPLLIPDRLRDFAKRQLVSPANTPLGTSLFRVLARPGTGGIEGATAIFDAARGTPVLEKIGHLDPDRRLQVMRFRRAHGAKRDATLVFRAAAEGRPLELQKRLRLGHLAGGLQAQGAVGGRQVTAMDAALTRGHTECVRVLEGFAARMGQGVAEGGGGLPKQGV